MAKDGSNIREAEKEAIKKVIALKIKDLEGLINNPKKPNTLISLSEEDAALVMKNLDKDKLMLIKQKDILQLLITHPDALDLELSNIRNANLDAVKKAGKIISDVQVRGLLSSSLADGPPLLTDSMKDFKATPAAAIITAEVPREKAETMAAAKARLSEEADRSVSTKSDGKQQQASGHLTPEQRSRASTPVSASSNSSAHSSPASSRPATPEGKQQVSVAVAPKAATPPAAIADKIRAPHPYYTVSVAAATAPKPATPFAEKADIKKTPPPVPNRSTKPTLIDRKPIAVAHTTHPSGGRGM